MLLLCTGRYMDLYTTPWSYSWRWINGCLTSVHKHTKPGDKCTYVCVFVCQCLCACIGVCVSVSLFNQRLREMSLFQIQSKSINDLNWKVTRRVVSVFGADFSLCDSCCLVICTSDIRLLRCLVYRITTSHTTHKTIKYVN